MNASGGSANYRVCLEHLLPYLGEMGIAAMYSTNQNGIQVWNNALLTPEGNLLLEHCLNN